MAGDTEPLVACELLTDGARHEGRDYVRGDVLRLPAKRVDRLEASGSVRRIPDPVVKRRPGRPRKAETE